MGDRLPYQPNFIIQGDKYSEEIKKSIENDKKELDLCIKKIPVYTYNNEYNMFSSKECGNLFPFTKRYCFSHEEEYRIIIGVPDKILPDLKEKGVYKFRESNGIMVPYIELNFDVEAIEGITLSPTIQIDTVEESVKAFLEYCDIKCDDISKMIKRSEVPVRF